MSALPAQVLADKLDTLLEATSPVGGETAEARAARKDVLRAELAACQPADMQELLLVTEMLAGHHIAMDRMRDAATAAPGTVQASRMLRDAIAMQRLGLAAIRNLRLWRKAARQAAHARRPRPAGPAPASPDRPALPSTATITPLAHDRPLPPQAGAGAPAIPALPLAPVRSAAAIAMLPTIAADLPGRHAPAPHRLSLKTRLNTSAALALG